MICRKLFWLGGLLAIYAAIATPARAQFQQQEPDPLARMRAAAASAQTQACTVKEPSACAEATPKIVVSALGSRQLEENFRHLSDTAAAPPSQLAAWAMAALRDAGVDEVHAEDLSTPPSSGVSKQVNVVGEIRGRDKPDEFVVLGAPLVRGTPEACNAALVIEAARDIHLTGLRPRRSIRFILFGEEEGLLGSQTYVRAHRTELDRAVAAIIFERVCSQVNGFSLGGRQDTEPGVRETFAVAPVDTWHVGHDTYDAPWGADNFDFLLEGVPTLLANREDAASRPADADLDTLKHNAAIAGVLAFALAEHPATLGPRLSRAEVAAALTKSGLDAQMKAANVWRDWQSGGRGRQP